MSGRPCTTMFFGSIPLVALMEVSLAKSISSINQMPLLVLVFTNPSILILTRNSLI